MDTRARSEFFYRLWPSEIERMRGLGAGDWPTFFYLLVTLLEDAPPPLVRADAFWRARTGCRTENEWRRRRDRMAHAGVIVIAPDGGISAPWAAADWACREKISRRNRDNARGRRGIVSSRFSRARVETESSSRRRPDKPSTLHNHEQNQLIGRAAEPRTPRDLEVESELPPLPPAKDCAQSAPKLVFCESELRQQCQAVKPSPALLDMVRRRGNGRVP